MSYSYKQLEAKMNRSTFPISVIENSKNDLTVECMFCSVHIVVKISIKNIFLITNIGM